MRLYSGASVLAIGLILFLVVGAGLPPAQISNPSEPAAVAGMLQAATATPPLAGGIHQAVSPARLQSPTPTDAPPITPTLRPDPGCVPDLDRSRLPGQTRRTARPLGLGGQEQHFICAPGEEHWFTFAAHAGTRATIDIPLMDAGLDLVLTLYGPDGALLAFNDDAQGRPPQEPPAPLLAPRLPAFLAPQDGLYTVLVQDETNQRADPRSYTIAISKETDSPRATPPADACLDRYEPDGLAQDASTILTNTVQVGHSFCPRADADWVRFWGAAGERYLIYTDTRPYRSGAPPGADAAPGADTVLALADRDGTTLLMVNDDRPDSLDSAIMVVPQEDGLYLVQIKNTGDIGEAFIRYDLGLKHCLPGEACEPPSHPAAP
ncbi:MAG TPA: PPC domain-containing protein [Roseiflexaceae bacterium]|nr:PPC domain-containing protein [Roseiflexaceae bacterium]